MAELGVLKLKGSGIFGTPLEVPVSLPIAVTKSIADIKEPQSRQGAFSKTVTIEGDTNINSAFRHIYEINKDITNTSGQYNPDFNPNKRVEVEYSIDGVIQMEGYMRLIEINKDLQTSKIVYSCQIFDEAADFWKEIDGKTMADIDLTKYNHTLNFDAIRKSWDQNIWENGVQVPFAYGKGYVHGLINRRPTQGGQFPTTKSWDVGDTTPMLYAKELVDKIYADAGVSYVSGGFFDTPEFKRWVVPYNGIGLGLLDATIQNNKVIADTTSTIIVNTSGATTNEAAISKAQIIFQDDSTPPNQDPGGNYNNSTGAFTAAFDGEFDVIVELDVSVLAALNTTYNNVLTILLTCSNGNVYYDENTSTHVGNSYSFGAKFFFRNVPLNSGDDFTVSFRNAPLVGQAVIQHQITVASGASFKCQVVNSYYSSGSEVNFEQFISKDVKQKDFMLDLVKTFNLYIDLDDEGRHIVKTRDDYYNNEVIDIEPYLNTAKEVVYEPMGALDANPYVFDYKEDKDLINEYYKGNYAENYGRKQYDVDNDFVTNTKTIQVTYSPTVMRFFPSTSMVIPDITFLTKDGLEDEEKKGNYRLLRYEGIEDCNAYVIDDGGNLNNMFAYPLIGHIDDPLEPTLDGLFGMPIKHYMRSDFKYSDNTLFFQYHLKQYKETTDKNSKLVHGYFNITPDFFPKIKFDKLYYFDNSYFRINKIFDYKPYTDTKIEFIKVIEYTKPSTGNGSGNGGIDDRDIFDEVYPAGTTLSPFRGNNTTQAVGTRNTLNNDSFAVGDYNIVLNGKVSLLSSSGNLVSENVTQATLINTNDAEITENGFYIDGKLLSMPTIYSLSADETSESATFASIADWQVPVESGKVYGITIVGYYKGATSNSSLNIGQELTTATGNINGLWEVTDLHGGTEDLHIKNIRLITDAYIGQHVGSIDTYFTFKANFTFECTASGTFGIRFASGNGDLITLRQNSKLQIIQL